MVSRVAKTGQDLPDERLDWPLAGVTGMLVKIVIVGLLLFMVFNLFLAMKAMLGNNPKHQPMSKYIGRRVMTSALIVVIILLAISTGLITPNPRPY